MQMEEQYYANVEYIDYQYFPVVPEDYTGTSDRPGCETPENGLHYPAQVCMSCWRATLQYPLLGFVVNCMRC